MMNITQTFSCEYIMPSWNLVSATVFAAALFHSVCAQSEQFLASVPAEFSNVSVALLEHNLAVIPGDWNVTDLGKINSV